MKENMIKFSILTALLLSQTLLAAQNNAIETSGVSEKEWGIGAVVRTATIPYMESEYSKDTTVSSFIPFLYYKGEDFYIDGVEIGYHLYKTPSWATSIFTRLRFTDLPSDLQNDIQEDNYDPGLKFRYIFEKDNNVDLELMSDYDGNAYVNLAYEKKFDLGDFEIKPYAIGTYKSADFNSKYYGLNIHELDGGFDFTAGALMRYHVSGNFYLLGNIQTKFLSQTASDSEFVKERRQDEIFLGIGLFNDKNKPLKKELAMKPFIKLAHGFATPSNLNDILSGNREDDEYSNQLTSIFYGLPLTDTLFSLPIELYLTPGFAWHHSSEVQNNIQEYIIAFRAYYTILLPWRVRLGIAEGTSYVNELTYIEESELEEKDYRSSKLLNYLGFSVDLSLSDIFGEKVEGLWLGYDIHHRSAIFESASQFGRIKGGSNYTTLYLQYHY